MANPFWDGNSSRKIMHRILIEGDLVLHTPAHFGNGESEEAVDMPLLVDPLTGKLPLLTGASLAGALRAYLCQLENGIAGNGRQPNFTVLLFGGEREDSDGEQSPLIVNDALGRDYGVELRSGVKINAKSRTAADRALYDMELWQAGTKFTISLELLIRERDNADDMKMALAVALTGLTNDGITLGARKRRGYGRIGVDRWRVRNFNLSRPVDLFAWIEYGGKALDKQTDAQVEAGTEIGALLGITNSARLESITNARKRFTVRGSFAIDGSLLIDGGGEVDSAAPDKKHISARQLDGNQRPVLPATSVGGALRARAFKIVNTLAGRTPARRLIDSMFGTMEVDSEACASRIDIREHTIEQPVFNLVQHRVSIDRFTGGARETALFNEQPVFPQMATRVTVDFSLYEPEQHEIGLLLLMIKDLCTGDLLLGGETAVGRGRLMGKELTLSHYTGDTSDIWKIRLDGNKLIFAQGEKEKLEQCVERLHDYLHESITE